MKTVIALLLAIMLLGCAEEKKELEDKPVEQPSLNPQIAVFKDKETWKAQVTFTLPSPCHKIDFTGKEVVNERIILKFSHTPPAPDEFCAQVVQTYNETVRIGVLDEGKYQVIVQLNGTEVKKIEITV